MRTVVTATALEYRAARKALPSNVRVVQAGIALAMTRARIEGEAISCGLAGGLRADLPTGTVLVPRSVMRPDGTVLICEERLVQALSRASRALGHEPVGAPLLTHPGLVRGPERERWAAQGFAGVDMESGLIDAARLACVRVILDTPSREISAAWLAPARAMMTPLAWLDLPFLIAEGPRCARLAAQIAAKALV